MRFGTMAVAVVCLLLGATACATDGQQAAEGTQRDAVCGEVELEGPVRTQTSGKLCDKLSSFRIFEYADSTFTPNDGVVYYDLITPLFTDYARKDRMIYVPEGAAAYQTDTTLGFPVGTIIAKTFSYPADMRQPDANLLLVETRLLVHQQDGWKALAYMWNDAQTDATASPLGGSLPVEWIHEDGTAGRTEYAVPRVQQCNECHSVLTGGVGTKEIAPIGPKVKHLNRDYAYADGTQNQLRKLQDAGYLTGVPADLSREPALAAYDDVSAPIEDRARAYLDANCAHCHNRKNTADTSGLLLNSEITAPERYGVCAKATRGEGVQSAHDIAPGDPDGSLMIERMESLDSEVMMPRLGRTLVHTEGVAVVRAWIAQMDGDCNGDAITAPTY